MTKNIFIKISALVFTAALISGPVFSSPVKISLDEAVKTALANNRDYKIAGLKVQEADEKVNLAWSQLIPSLESEASYLKQYAEKGLMSLSDGQMDLKLVQLRFGINPGVFYNSLRSSREAHVIADEEMRRVKSEVVYNVIKGYFDYLLSDDIIKLRKESIELYKSNLSDVQQRYNKGTVPKFELLQAQVELNNREPQLLEAENKKQAALDIFNYNLGLDEVSYEPDYQILEAEIRNITAINADEHINKLILIAMRSRPEVIQIAGKKAIAENSADMNSSYYIWPTFSIGGYYGYTKNDPNAIDAGAYSSLFSGITGDDQWQNTWAVKVAATYRWGSLLPVDSTRAMAREEKIKIQEAENEIMRIKRLIAISVKNNYNKLLTSNLTIISQKKNVGTAVEGLRIAKESYAGGIIRNSELLSAQMALSYARTSYINAVYSFYTSLAELKKDTCIEEDNIIFEPETLK